jgi:hypothetical protein
MQKGRKADGVSLRGLIPQLTLIVLPFAMLLLLISLASLSLQYLHSMKHGLWWIIYGGFRLSIECCS